MEELTEKQKDVLNLIHKWKEEHGFPPSVRDVAAHFDVSVTAAAQHLQALIRKNVLHREAGKGRALTVSEEWLPEPPTRKEQGAEVKLLRVPLFTGRIAAGFAQELDSDPEDYLEFSQDLLGRGQFVAVKVHGLSMSGDYIDDGDTAIIKLQKDCGPKDIVAVRVGGSEVTLKRIRRKQALCELVPSNPQFKVREVAANQVEILGKLVSILRHY